jgi:hypothetical protein
MSDREQIIELRAVNPDGDLACDFTIANDMARGGLREGLAAGIVPPVRRIEGGVEVRFRADAETAVRRYVELESRCCSFLTLAIARDDDGLVLSITGRPEARELIENIFPLLGDSRD